jgi:hypothetical protein
MKFFKKIFGKYNQKKNVDDYDIKYQELVRRNIEKFETLDDNMIEEYDKYLKEFKPTNSSQKMLLTTIKAGIANNKASKVEKIVNDYGKALMEATEINKRKLKEFMEILHTDTLKALKYLASEPVESINYPFQNKFDIRLLQYDKEKIREAIELFLQDETDPNRIEQLKAGLLFLDDFIDYSKFVS